MIRDPATTELAPPGRLEAIPARWSAAGGASLALADARGEWSWRELEHGRKQLAELLLTLGIRAGDRVMVIGENCATMVALLFAIWSVNGWAVNVNARLSPREIDAVRAHCGARRLLFLGDDSPDARHHAERMQATRLSLGRWGTISVGALDERCVPEPVEGQPARDVAALLYTTGTTGEPKAVMLTHANLLFIARVSAELRGITPRDRVFGLLPISHVYGLASVCLGTLRAGGSLYLQARFTPAAMAECLSTKAITVCQGVPAMYAKLLEHLRSRGTRFAAPSLRFLYAGGSPLSPALKGDVEATLGLTLHNGYGLTEASPTIMQTRFDEPRSDCSVGRALPGVEVRIVDPEGKDVAPGGCGELWARGPNIMKGYYRDPEATRAALKPGGWLATGDIARRGEDGAYFIEGRLKELIIRSGFNVFPVEVEAVLNSHPEVTQSAVVGRPADGDEEVVAFVELVAGAVARAVQAPRRDRGAGVLAAGAQRKGPQGPPRADGARAARLKELFVGRERADVAAHLPAFLHQHLAVADLAGHASARVDHELLPRRHLALELAADFGHVDVHLPHEGPALGDLDGAAHHGRLDAALDHQRVAIVDLDALQLDVGSDDELGALLGARDRRLWRRHGRRHGRRGTHGGGSRCRGGRWMRRVAGCGRRGTLARRMRRITASEETVCVFHCWTFPQG